MSEQPLKGFGEKPVTMSDLRKLNSFGDKKPTLELVEKDGNQNKLEPSLFQSVDEYGQDKYGQVEISKDKRVEISPSKNFTKTSNSIVKTAIPEKYFRGQSKHTYDVLYQRTRGAISPVRQVQLSKTELVRLTGLSEKTVQLHIRYLRDSGLIAVFPQIGSHVGWLYEIFVPEEIEGMDKYGQDKSSMDKSGMDKTSRNLSRETMQNLSILDHTNPLENKELSESVRLSLKTNTNDDELTRKINEILLTAHGRELTEKEKGSTAINDFIVEQFTAAIKNAKTISDVPAFIVAILSRPSPSEKPAKSANRAKEIPKTSDSVAVEPYEPAQLTEETRQTALETLETILADGKPIEPFRGNYTKTDWQWLNKNLK